MGARAARRDHAVADDALSRVLGAGTSRRLRRAGDRRLRALCELERAAADPVRHAAAGNFLLGPDRLSDRRPGVPAHRPAGARADRRAASLLDPRPADRDRLDDADHDRGALHLGVSGDLHSALGQPAFAQARSGAALARSVLAVVHRRARRGLARSRLGHSLRARQRRAVSAPRTDPIRDLRRHRHHAGRPRPDAADGGALARPSPRRQEGAQGRDQARAARAPGRA